MSGEREDKEHTGRGEELGYIFLGYIFVFFHLRINGFDFLADFAGYALIGRGLRLLAEESVNFEKASPWAFGMMLVEAGRLFLAGFSHPVLTIFNFFTLLAALYIEYRIVGGINDLEKTYSKDLGAENLLFFWKIKAVLVIVCALLSLIPHEITVIMAAILTVAVIILNIIFLLFLHRVRKALEPDGNPQA